MRLIFLLISNDYDDFIFYLSTPVDVFVVVVLNGLDPSPDDCHLSLVVGGVIILNTRWFPPSS
jgi:hypothetical protein